MTGKPIVALLYDFDKTLCTTDMEDYTFIPSLGMTPREFWGIANRFGQENHMDALLAYMYTMIAECKKRGIRMDRDYLVRCGKDMELFPGVRDWFSRINAFGESLNVQVEHYVLSSGLKEIIEGSGISHEFKEIYACEFLYGEDGIASWPKLDVNFTNKTQFVYRINKGVLDIANDKDLNASMPDDSKRIPFTNMIYVGDGLSDVPCMKMMQGSDWAMPFPAAVHIQNLPRKAELIYSLNTTDFYASMKKQSIASMIYLYLSVPRSFRAAE